MLAAMALASVAWADGTVDPVSVARVRPAGGYAQRPGGFTATLGADGAVLVLGQSVLADAAPAPRVAQWLTWLRDRRPADANVNRPPTAQWWQPKAQRWAAAEPPPQCPQGLRSFHTATLLSGDRVLIGGGVCDPLDGARPTTHADLAVFDLTTGRWAAAGRLTDARLLHSATVMTDGAVVYAGGVADPAVMRLDGWAVQRSVERWQAGEVQPLPPLLSARAGHTATALPDGGLLVVGGFDAQARPMAAVERWQPAAQRWQALPSLGTPREGHAAVTLPDGRVMVLGGRDGAGEALRSTELFDPASQRWSPGPLLPVGLDRPAATRLRDGAVLVAGGFSGDASRPMPWAWLWQPEMPGWRVAGRVAGDRHEAAAQTQLQPLPDGGALAFMDREILRIERLPQGPPPLQPGEVEAPVWHQPPALGALTGGQVLAVGRAAGAREAVHIARLWERATGRWQALPDVPTLDLQRAAIQQLPSGRVLLVATTADDQLVCWSWQRGRPDWAACGGVPLLQRAQGPVVLGFLPGGRLVAMPSPVQAVVYDETAGRWVDWRVRKGEARMDLGAPVIPRGALAELQDPEGGPPVRIDTLMQQATLRHLRGTQTPIGVWDARQQRWAAVLPQAQFGEPVGWLPDDCALSLAPLAVFDPRTTVVTYPADPGLARPAPDAHALLDDGTLVTVDAETLAGDPGAQWRVARASCAGLQMQDPVQPYFSPEAPRPPYQLPNTVMPADRPGATEAALARRPDPFNGKGKWVIGAAALALLMLGAGWFRAGGRGVMQSAVVLALLGGGWWYSTRQGAERRALALCEEDIAGCLEPSGLLRPAPGGGPSRIPCEFVGLWTWSSPTDSRRLELKADGRFVMAASAKDPNVYRGHWAVQRFGNEERFVWRAVPVFGDWDVNPFVKREAGTFELAERIGVVTHYERVETRPTEGCQP